MEKNREKLWNLIDACDTAALITLGAEGFPRARTMECMRLPQVEEIWFTTDANEQKLKEIAQNAKVTVFYSLPDKSWATVSGQAERVDDPNLKNKLWHDDWEKYFPDGPASPDYVLIRIVPQSARYLLSRGYEQGEVQFA